ncbi:MAG: hypothetical protein BYD32DRAFT_460543 [Podila humilis]|nr:MAG: hypothetical protein BYD32DRAFT_460543 [Podila humilis]
MNPLTPTTSVLEQHHSVPSAIPPLNSFASPPTSFSLPPLTASTVSVKPRPLARGTPHNPEQDFFSLRPLAPHPSQHPLQQQPLQQQQQQQYPHYQQQHHQQQQLYVQQQQYAQQQQQQQQQQQRQQQQESNYQLSPQQDQSYPHFFQQHLQYESHQHRQQDQEARRGAPSTPSSSHTLPSSFPSPALSVAASPLFLTKPVYLSPVSTPTMTRSSIDPVPGSKPQSSSVALSSCPPSTGASSSSSSKRKAMSSSTSEPPAAKAAKRNETGKSKTDKPKPSDSKASDKHLFTDTEVNWLAWQLAEPEVYSVLQTDRESTIRDTPKEKLYARIAIDMSEKFGFEFNKKQVKNKIMKMRPLFTAALKKKQERSLVVDAPAHEQDSDGNEEGAQEDNEEEEEEVLERRRPSAPVAGPSGSHATPTPTAPTNKKKTAGDSFKVQLQELIDLTKDNERSHQVESELEMKKLESQMQQWAMEHEREKMEHQRKLAFMENEKLEHQRKMALIEAEQKDQDRIHERRKMELAE